MAISTFFWHDLLARWFGASGRTREKPRPAARRRRLMPCLEALEQRTLPSNTVEWTGLSDPPDPSWSNPQNWSGDAPQSGDTVVFKGSESHLGTSTVDSSFAGDKFTIMIDNTWGGSLNLDTSLTLTGNSELGGIFDAVTGINLQGNTLTNTGTLSLITAPGNLAYLFDNSGDNLGGTLVNQGTIVQGGGGLGLLDNTQIENQAGATYNFTADSGISGGSTGFGITNAGTVEKTGGSQTSTIAVPFSNLKGTVAVTSGRLQISSTSSGGASTGGTFNAGKGATLDLTGDGAVNVFTGSYTGSGQGAVVFGGGGTLVIGSGGATFDFTPGLLQWDSAFDDFDGINLQGNTLTNAGSLTLISPYTASLYASINGSGNQGGTLINQGTIIQRGGGDLEIDDSVQLQNQAGATYDFTSDGSITGGTAGFVMSNAGTVEKTGGIQTSEIEVPFSNLNGTVVADSGWLQISGQATGGISTGGTFNAGKGATLDLTGNGAFNVFTGNYTGSGKGAVVFGGGGSLLIGSPGATFKFPAGLLRWDSAFDSYVGMNLQGHTFTNAGFLTLINPPGETTQLYSSDNGGGNLGGALINQGTIIQAGGDLGVDDSVQLNNQAKAVYNFTSDGSISGGAPGYGMTNAGTVEKTSGTGTSSITLAFSNLNGTVTANKGTLQISSQYSGGASTGGKFNAAAGATLDLTGNNANNVFTGRYTGSGKGAIVFGEGGSLVIGPAGATFAFPAGLLQWSSASDTFGGINLQGHTLTNAGFLTLINPEDTYLFANDNAGGDLGGTLVNTGTIIQRGGGNLTLSDSVLLKNQAKAIYDFASDVNISFEANCAMSNAGTLEKTGGTGISSVDPAFTNTGTVQVKSGTLQLTGGLSLNGSAALRGSPTGTLSVQGDILGNTTNSRSFAPLDTVVLTGPGSGEGVQLLEVMSRDRGKKAAGFSKNFAYGTLEVVQGNDVQLVDQARNSPGHGHEALYVNTLIVHGTLDLNHLHVYARVVQIDGQVINGKVSLVP